MSTSGLEPKLRYMHGPGKTISNPCGAFRRCAHLRAVPVARVPLICYPSPDPYPDPSPYPSPYPDPSPDPDPDPIPYPDPDPDPSPYPDPDPYPDPSCVRGGMPETPAESFQRPNWS